MNKYAYLLLSAFCFLLVACGGTPTPTIDNPVSVTITDCTNTSPFSSNPFQMSIHGDGAFRMDNNGTISFIQSGTFQLEFSTTIVGCVPSYPAFSGYIISGTGNRLTGYNADSSGTLATTLSDLNIFNGGSMAPAVTQNVTAKMHLDSSVGTLPAGAFDPSNAATYHYATAINVHDSLGTALSLQIFYIHTAAMTWHAFVVGNGSTTDIGQLNFNTSGSLISSSLPVPMQLSIPVTTGAITPLVMTFNPSGTSESPSAFSAISLTQDGYASGTVNGFTIDINGRITGAFTNGQSRVLGQVAIVSQ